MSDNGKILAVIEPDNHPYGVISRAVWLAQRTGCTLELLLCDPDIGAMQHGFFVSNEARDIGEKIRAAQKEIIDELAQEARDKGIEVVTDVLEGRPISDGVIQRAMEINPRYVIKGTEYHSIAERSIFVDTDWQLIRTCPFPLWLVKPHEMRDKPVILAAVDPVHSHDKPAALDQVIVDNAKVVAAASDGEIHLLHVYQRIAGIGREATKTFKPIQLPIDELSEKIKQEHREKLDALAEANGIDAEHTHQLPGSARKLLPTFSRSYKTDLVVLGSLARWGLKKMVLGSTAEKVLDHLPCDILIVRVQYQE